MSSYTEDLYTRVPVLDHGYIQLIDVMGTDESIVEAARMSTTGQAGLPDEQRKLLRYMVSHRHTSPFEMASLIFEAKMPIVVARQWVRHRTASLNEFSGRYSQLPDEAYLPPRTRIAASAQNTVNRQGSTDGFPEDKIDTVRSTMQAEQGVMFANYQDYLDMGMSKELARNNVPVSTYTKWRWKMNLHNLLHFMGLRLDEHAQWEIQQYAWGMYNVTKKLFPMSVEAWEDYIFYSHHMNRMEVDKLVGDLDAINNADTPEVRDAALQALVARVQRVTDTARVKPERDPVPVSWNRS